jgi:quinoprotein dehydrogenase-associated probable ABC transporter substrate-binding protein
VDRALPVFALLSVLLLLAPDTARAADPADTPPRSAFRVCQDPNNLPFSNVRGEGLENKIAELFGQALGLPVTYYSFPQRMGFIRNTLRLKLPDADFPCDIVMGVPVGFDQVSVTQPYYTSTYVLVLARGRGLDGVSSVADFLRLDAAKLASLRIGVFDRSPASAWLERHRLVDQGVPYAMLNADPQSYAGEIVEKDLVAGKIDAAIVWGPIAGYFAQRVKTVELFIVPMRSEQGIRFEYPMAMGVRYGEREWKRQIEDLIVAKRDEIRGILKTFGVPLVEDGATGNAGR